MTVDRRGNRPSGLDRRRFLRGAAYLGAAAGSPALFAGCATSGGRSPEPRPKATGKKTAQNPFGVDPEAPLEVVIFNGGYGHEYAQFHESLYQKKFPKAEIKHTPTQEIQGQLQTRFVQRNPPDVVDNSGAQAIPAATLVNNGQLTELDDTFMNAPSIDDPNVTLAESVIDGTFDQMTFDGKVYGMSYVVSAWGLWYDANLFAQNDWEPPRTWDELLALGEKTKAKGIPLLTYQGQHPVYMNATFLYQGVQKHGGKEVMRRIDNLEDGAWFQQPVRDVVEALYELKVKGHIMPGTAALDHIQAQSRWLRHKAALIPCGGWLWSEMKSQVPKDFDMAIQPVPLLDENDPLPFEASNFAVGEPFIVPADAKNVAGGLEYLRIMLSKEGAQKFAELNQAITCVKGAHDDQELGATVASSQELIKKASEVERLDDVKFAGWYEDMKAEIEAAMGALLTSPEVKPDDFLKRAQKVADEVKANPKIKKFTR